MSILKVNSDSRVYEITFDGKKLISELLLGNGIYVEHPCGGKGSCKKCTVILDGKEVLSCRTYIENDTEITISEPDGMVSESGANETGENSSNTVLCLDIGTTTLALALVSVDTKSVVKVYTCTNPQRVYGADVITRIDHCSKHGVIELKNGVINAINRLLFELKRDYSVSSAKKLYVSGNTTMLHLFFGVDCSAMGFAPYTPSFIDEKRATASSLGIDLDAEIISLPSISAFVGADIVAGLNYVGLPENGKYSLLIDLGTNAEIVLFSDKGGLTTAAAAGPCFEGANISCGMSATEGAIYTFEENDGEIQFSTIGNTSPKGICGTGLIDLISILLEKGIVDETGFMEYGDYLISDEVSFTGGDVRQYQLAKSAVYSAIRSLMKLRGVKYEDISKMYISGGFSAKINVINAVKTGLLPSELISKTVAINNSSLLGTVKFALDGGDLLRITSGIRYVDLSADPYFSDQFIENMMFE